MVQVREVLVRVLNVRNPHASDVANRSMDHSRQAFVGIQKKYGGKEIGSTQANITTNAKVTKPKAPGKRRAQDIAVAAEDDENGITGGAKKIEKESKDTTAEVEEDADNGSEIA
jgi:hypothetical protein